MVRAGHNDAARRGTTVSAVVCMIVSIMFEVAACGSASLLGMAPNTMTHPRGGGAGRRRFACPVVEDPVSKTGAPAGEGPDRSRPVLRVKSESANESRTARDRPPLECADHIRAMSRAGGAIGARLGGQGTALHAVNKSANTVRAL